MDDKAWQLLMDKINKIEANVDGLMAYKWQLMGGSFIIGILIQIGIALYFKK